MSNRNASSPSASGDVTTGLFVSEPVLRMAHDGLHASPTNPRKHFAEGPLLDLAANILALARRGIGSGTNALGVQQPLFVRVSPYEPGKHEIIAGERRWRACERAMEMVQLDEDGPHVIERLMVVPVLLKTWTDAEVVEFQLIENLQREDLTPMEEADGYRRLMGMGHSAEEIAAKVGVGVEVVYRALRWNRLPPLAREPFEARLIGKDLATLIARVPGELDRRKATLVLLYGVEPWNIGETEAKVVEAEAGETLETLKPLPVRQARSEIAAHFLVSLDSVTFDLADADLVPVKTDAAGERECGGACHGCPHRVADNPSLADMMTEGASGARTGNLCTQPPCRAMKIRAQFARDAAAAQQKGVKVLAEDDSKKLFYQSGSLVHGSEYVAVNEKPGFDLTGQTNTAKVKTWEAMLKGVQVEQVLAQKPDGSPVMLVRREVAVLAVNEACAAKGKETPLAHAAVERVNHDKVKEEQQKEAEKKKIDQRAYNLALAAIAQCGADKGLEGLKLLAKMTLHAAGMDGLRALAKGLGIEPEVPKGETVNQGHYGAAIIAACVEPGTLVTLPGLITAAVVAQQSWRGLDCVNLKEACALYGIGITAMKAEARDELKKKKGKDSAAGAKGKPDGMGAGQTMSGAPADSAPEGDEYGWPCHSCVDVLTFARVVMHEKVKASKPNKNEVFTTNTGFKLTAGKCSVMILLAVTKEGKWATGYHYEGNGATAIGGGGLPHVRLLVDSRVGAVLAELTSLIDHLTDHAYAKLVEMLKEVRQILTDDLKAEGGGDVPRGAEGSPLAGNDGAETVYDDSAAGAEASAADADPAVEAIKAGIRAFRKENPKGTVVQFALENTVEMSEAIRLWQVVADESAVPGDEVEPEESGHEDRWAGQSAKKAAKKAARKVAKKAGK